MKHLRYLWYVARHKWFVLRAGMMLRDEYEASPLRMWQLIVHDLSKFTSRERFPYVEAFYGKNPTERRNDGSYDATRVSSAFDYAWLSHQRNKHHWQAWTLVRDDGSIKALKMGERFVWEMLADWMGAGMAQKGHGLDRAWEETFLWYQENRHRMELHPESRALIEDLIFSQMELEWH